MGPLFSKTHNSPPAGIAGPVQSFTLVEQRVEVEPFESPRFDPNDPALVQYLDDNGYVVIKGVASEGEVETATNLLWQFLEGETIGMKRNSPRTWTQRNFQNVGLRSNGILAFNGIQQSDFLWFVRMLPKVKQPFEHIFGTDDLLTSYDGGNIFRPWHARGSDDNCKTECGWWHVDQGKLLRGRHAVQGLVTLRDVGPETGGFCVIPGSHRCHDELLEEVQIRSDKNFIFVPPSFHALQDKQILPVCQAGDMILWDSRTIHCNTPALVYPKSQPTKVLLRAVAYVCMTPSSFATADAIEKRKLIYELGDGTSHWPHLIPYDVDETREKQTFFESAPLEKRKLIAGCAGCE